MPGSWAKGISEGVFRLCRPFAVQSAFMQWGLLTTDGSDLYPIADGLVRNAPQKKRAPWRPWMEGPGLRKRRYDWLWGSHSLPCITRHKRLIFTLSHSRHYHLLICSNAHCNDIKSIRVSHAPTPCYLSKSMSLLLLSKFQVFRLRFKRLVIRILRTPS